MKRVARYRPGTRLSDASSTQRASLYYSGEENVVAGPAEVPLAGLLNFTDSDNS